MATAYKFPDEVWLCITNELSLLPDLLHLSLSCTRLRNISAERLYKVREQLRREYRSFNAHDAGKINNFPWHVLLLKILRGQVPPTCLVDVNSYLECVALSDGVSDCRSYSGTPDLSIDDKERIRCAIDSSPWIHKKEVQD